MERRLLLAFVLSAVIFAVWSLLFPPPSPRTPARIDRDPLTAENGSDSGITEGEAAGGDGARSAEVIETAGEARADGEVVGEAIQGERDERVVLSNPVQRVEIATRGGAVASLILTQFTDDEGRPLELVQSVDHAERALPLQLIVDRKVDWRVYVAEREERAVTLRWADGLGTAVEKRLSLPKEGYGIDVVLRTRGRETVEVSVGTGMRDRGVREEANRFSTWGDAIIVVGDEVQREKRQKLKETVRGGGPGLRFAGFEDTYFLNVLRLPSGGSGVEVRPLEVAIPAAEDGSGAAVESVLRIAVEAGEVLEGQLFAAPKEYDLLHAVDAGVEESLDFGFFHPISVLFLKALRWIFGIVGNYGLAIIFLTIAIRVVLFPLMHTSTVSMRKMQRVQPKMKAIQEKYRKNKTDPQVRAKMNQEVMELYRMEGVNPMGGCLPLLVQLPILFALYSLFAYAIELRHAPFMWWITDLSAKDPYYITPILMTATMWLQQKLAPQVGDPQQQKIFRLMPLIFGVMFLGFPSGLVLYWLVNNVITIAQQEVTLHLIGERRRGKSGGR